MIDLRCSFLVREAGSPVRDRSASGDQKWRACRFRSDRPSERPQSECAVASRGIDIRDVEPSGRVHEVSEVDAWGIEGEDQRAELHGAAKHSNKHAAAKDSADINFLVRLYERDVPVESRVVLDGLDDVVDLGLIACLGKYGRKAG